MSQFLSHPKFQAFDSNGDPLNGGKLHTYEPGTTTNKASYPTLADAAAGTNANANPVILDSRGEADVVLVGNTKLVLKDSSDNTIWTLDNVNSDGDILDGNGNQLLEFTSVSSATNHVGIVNAATGENPKIRAEGEADTGLTFDNEAGEEILILDSIASAVNECTIKNAATGSNPEISATGGDLNIGIDWQSKGTGPYRLLGTSDQGAKLQLFEDTDNGTNYISIDAPASISENRTITLSDEDITLSISTQAEMEAASSTTDFVTPGRFYYHPAAAKAWVHAEDSGTLAIAASYNISSVDDDGTGDYGVNLSITFSSTAYCVTMGIQHTGGVDGGQLVGLNGQTTTAVELLVTANTGDSDSPNIATNTSELSLAFYGDL